MRGRSGCTDTYRDTLLLVNNCKLFTTPILNLSTFSYQENLETDGADDVIAALETLILLLTFSNEKHPLQLKIALKCAVRLCKAKQEYCEVFVELLGTRLDNIDSR